MSPDHLALGVEGVLCLALGGAMLEGDRKRRLAAAGFLAVGLAIAAWRAGSPPGGAPVLPAPGSLGRGFLVGNSALLLVGVALVVMAAVAAVPSRFRLLARMLAAGGVVLLGPLAMAFAGAAGPLRATAAAAGLGLVGLAVVVGARAVALRPLAAKVAARVAPPPLDVGQPAGVRLRVALAAGVLAAVLGPHTAIVFAGLIAAAWSGYLIARREGGGRVPVAPVLTLLLVPAWWLLATVAGPAGLATASLTQVPLSPAAELLVSPALLVAGWAAAGLWPLQRQLPGALLAPAAAALLARVALPLAPDGLEYWRPLIVPLFLPGLWHAAAHARWPLLLGGAAVLGVAAGVPVKLASVAALALSAAALELGAASPAPAAQAARIVVWPVAAWAGLHLLEAGLRGEVVYTTLGALGLALILVGHRARAR